MELVKIDRSIGFDGVRQRVNAAIGGNLWRAAVGERRIDDGEHWPQILAEGADLDVVSRVGQHSGVRNLAPGASGCWTANQRQNRSGHVVEAEIPRWLAA